MDYIKKYSKGEPITSLDEMMEQDFIYWSGIITAKQWFKNWQIDMAFRAIKNGVIFRAAKIESEESQSMDNYYKWSCSNGIHKVKITLQCENYKGYLIVEIWGNAKGNDILKSINMENFCGDEIVENNCEFKYIKDGWNGLFSFKLTNEDGKAYEIKEQPYDVNNYVVAIEIIDFKED